MGVYVARCQTCQGTNGLPVEGLMTRVNPVSGLPDFGITWVYFCTPCMKSFEFFIEEPYYAQEAEAAANIPGYYLG